MKLSANDQESILSLLTRIYMDIVAIEEEYQLLVGEGDFRPRIEYFHDAIRAYTAQEENPEESQGRLGVELLSYDLSCLRYIQDMPLSDFKPHASVMSARTDIVTAGPGLNVRPIRPDRKVRARLCELYQHYAVLFSALLKPYADEDYRERIEELNLDIKDIEALADQLKNFDNSREALEALIAATRHVEEEQLRHLLNMFIQYEKYKKQQETSRLLEFLKQQTAERKKRINAVETAHMQYSLNQLGIFENSRDLIKKMALQGTNIVGKFVESSIAATRREIGR